MSNSSMYKHHEHDKDLHKFHEVKATAHLVTTDWVCRVLCKFWPAYTSIYSKFWDIER